MGNVLTVRVDEQTKKAAQMILKDLGLDLSTAVNMYLKQIIKKGGIPFMIDQTLSKETLQAIKDADEGKLYGPVHSIDELMNELDKPDDD